MCTYCYHYILQYSYIDNSLKYSRRPIIHRVTDGFWAESSKLSHVIKTENEIHDQKVSYFQTEANIV